MPPWLVEDEASQLWWERWRVMRQETRQAAPKKGKSKAGLGKGSVSSDEAD